MIDLNSCLKERFLSDLDNVALCLITKFQLNHKQKSNNLSMPLLRWLDFRFRYVEPKPREIIYSDKLHIGIPKNSKDISKNSMEALKQLETMITKGKDINPYQSKTLFHNDVSSTKKQERTDLLWADFKIHHFHLNKEILNGNYFSERSEWLLFCLIEENQIAFLDVCRHQENMLFQETELLEIIIRNWPEYMEQFRLKGTFGGKQYSKEQIKLKRANGLSYIITNKEGKCYIPPGLGVDSSATSTFVSLSYLKIKEHLRELADEINNPNSIYQQKMAEINMKNPFFKLELTQKGLSVYETNSKTAFLLPRENKKYYLTNLHNVIAPEYLVR